MIKPPQNSFDKKQQQTKPILKLTKFCISSKANPLTLNKSKQKETIKEKTSVQEQQQQPVHIE